MLLASAHDVDSDPISFAYDGDMWDTSVHNVNGIFVCDLGFWGGKEENADGYLLGCGPVVAVSPSRRAGRTFVPHEMEAKREGLPRLTDRAMTFNGGAKVK